MARARSIGNVYAELSVKDKMTMGLKKSRAALNKYGSAALKVGGVVAGAMSAAMIVGAKRTITLGAELDHLSTQTGLAVSSLMTLGQAYKDNGKDAGTVSKDIGKMQKAIFEAFENPSTSIDYFKEIGLSAAALMQMSPEEQFFAIGDAIKSIENQTKKTAAAMGIFGRAGAGLITVFEGSNLDDVNASLGKMPQLMQQFSGALERADTLMGRLPNKSDQFFAGFTTGIIGEILPGLEAVNDKDFSLLGENIGIAVSNGIVALKDGKIWEVFSLQGQKAMLGLQTSPAFNGLAAAINATLDFGARSENGGSQNWSESYEKYKNAGIDANSDLMDDADARIKELLDSIAESAKQNRRQAEEIIAPPTAPSIVDVVSSSKSKSGASSWMESAFSVNSAQSSGLSFEKSPAIQEGKKQTTLLGQIKDILGRAELDGGLLWR